MRNPLIKFASVALGIVALPASLALFSTDAVAQTESGGTSRPQPPQGPLLASAGDFSQWVITLSYPSPPAVETRSKTITTTRTGDTVHEEIVSGTGEKTNKWYIRGSEYMQITGMKTWLQLRPGEATGYSPLPSNGYHDLEWINADAYRGIIKHGGQDCLLFVTNVPKGFSLTTVDDPTKGLASLSQYALIDLKSRRPVEARINSTTEVYQFGEDPSEKQALPADLAQVIKDGIEMRARISQPAPRPY